MLQTIPSQKTPIFSYSMVFFGFETLWGAADFLRPWSKHFLCVSDDGWWKLDKCKYLDHFKEID